MAAATEQVPVVWNVTTPVVSTTVHTDEVEEVYRLVPELSPAVAVASNVGGEVYGYDAAKAEPPDAVRDTVRGI
jgi:hypothetical protein